MRPFLPLAKLLGLGAPESIVVLIILLVFFSGYAVSGSGEGGARRSSDPGLTPSEKQIVIAIGAVLALGLGIVVWSVGSR
jgi:hypothetical protein